MEDLSFYKELASRIRLSGLMNDLAQRTHKIGKSIMMLCPYHGDNNPSMILDDKNGRFHCFGCGKKGNMVEIYSYLSGLSMEESRRRLAELAGIRSDDSMEVIANLLHDAAIKDRSCLKYGFTEEMLNGFRLGYWSEGMHLSKIPKELLSIDSRPLLSGRITIPLLDEHGSVVGFQGRDLTGHSRSKYLTTKDWKGFSRSDYIMDTAKYTPYKGDDIFLVEGPKDAMALGILGRRTLATLGSAITDSQVDKILKRLKGNLYLAMDDDEAGMISKVNLIARLPYWAAERTKVVYMRGYKDISEIIFYHGLGSLHDLEVSAMDIKSWIYRIRGMIEEDHEIYRLWRFKDLKPHKMRLSPSKITDPWESELNKFKLRCLWVPITSSLVKEYALESQGTRPATQHDLDTLRFLLVGNWLSQLLSRSRPHDVLVHRGYLYRLWCDYIKFFERSC